MVTTDLCQYRFQHAAVTIDKGAKVNMQPSYCFRPHPLAMQSDRPFMGICLGLQLLFDGGDENGGVEAWASSPAGWVSSQPPQASLCLI